MVAVVATPDLIGGGLVDGGVPGECVRGGEGERKEREMKKKKLFWACPRLPTLDERNFKNKHKFLSSGVGNSERA